MSGSPEDAGARVISSDTLRMMTSIRRGPGDDAPVIGLSRSRIEVRISRAAEQAGLGEGFSGNSPRLGMLLDLEELGVSLLADELVVALEEL